MLTKANITTSVLVPAGYNGLSAGPIVVGAGGLVTVETGAEWTVV